MNQILSFQTIGNSKIQLKKVIRFFSIFIILFALILVIEGSFGYYKNKNKKVVIKETPDINIQRDNGTTILNITSNIGVQKVIYSWNDGIEDSVGVQSNDERQNFFRRGAPSFHDKKRGQDNRHERRSRHRTRQSRRIIEKGRLLRQPLQRPIRGRLINKKID